MHKAQNNQSDMATSLSTGIRYASQDFCFKYRTLAFATDRRVILGPHATIEVSQPWHPGTSGACVRA